MPRIRRNVWDLGSDWADPILWYARGVAALKALPLDEPGSWRFYAAIHGIDEPLWRMHGYLSQADKKPSKPQTDRFWKQCQHGSWYFLPWHRGYVLAFEANIRSEVTRLGGPENWALPYWDYFKPNQFKLPPAFASANWPDGQGNNPLFVDQRYGPDNNGNVYVPIDMVTLDGLNEPEFTGVTGGGTTGFGGVDTGFEHGGQSHGVIETQPHDWVHGLVGGRSPRGSALLGLMSDPDTAALDPIFWLHHANLDRLWEVWRRSSIAHLDPTSLDWLNGPGSVGQRIFSMPMPGNQTWDFTPGKVTDLAVLDYEYEDVSLAPAVPQTLDRMVRLGASIASAVAIEKKASTMTIGKVQLLGANVGPLQIVGQDIRTPVRLDRTTTRAVSSSLRAVAKAKVPDRVFLNLENVRGLDDSTAFRVYVGLSEGEEPGDRPDLLAGSIALFGLRKASDVDGPHSGKGLNLALEVTSVIDSLHVTNRLDVDSLEVRLVPVRPVLAESRVSIQRISLFRQAAKEGS